jgi:dCTP diphosphatase
MDIEALMKAQREFVGERDWDKFHSPKNLAMSLMIEAGELGELFQWASAEDSQKIMSDPKQAAKVRDELADVFFYVLRLSDKLGIPLDEAFHAKMKKNAERYPAEWSKGHATKYTERPGQ